MKNHLSPNRPPVKKKGMVLRSRSHATSNPRSPTLSSEDERIMTDSDTIAAIATPPGQAGIGVIRISGSLAPDVARALFRPSSPNCTWQSHHAYHGDILTVDGQTVLDEALATLMRKPHSFTGEDVLELSCHGNPLILHTILEQLTRLGCRLAGPGEFSRRAFLNGRMDLSQAEALASMITAPSPRAFALGLAQLKGALGRTIQRLRTLLIDALAILDASIDFTEDLEENESLGELPQINEAIDSIEALLATYESGKIITQGLSVVITGKPNVGKSSLLNSLAGRKKAIVTDIPGTTRDLIEETITVGGICLTLMDTAGIRTPQDIIEKEGIDLVWDRVEQADVIVIVLDGSSPLTDEDIHLLGQHKTRHNHLIIAVNKSDLPQTWTAERLCEFFSSSPPILNISAKDGSGLSDLKEAIVKMYRTSDLDGNDGVVIQLRHKVALNRALMNLKTAQANLQAKLSPEFPAFELREAIAALDEITGLKIQEEILDKIFSSFCIGK